MLANSGEDDVIFSTESDYAANIELAEAVAIGERAAPTKAMELVDTPNDKTLLSWWNSSIYQLRKRLKL